MFAHLPTAIYHRAPTGIAPWIVRCSCGAQTLGDDDLLSALRYWWRHARRPGGSR
jgi:hypothetical protein